MSDTQVYKKLQGFEFFRSLSPLELQEVASHCEVLHIKSNHVLFSESSLIDAVFLILYGSFKIQQKTQAKEPVIFNFLSRGDFLGVAMAGVRNAVYPASAVANEESAVFKFPLKYFNAHFMQHPHLRLVVTQQIADRFLEFQNDRCMTNALTQQKLASFLLRTLDRQSKDHGQRLMIPLTRQDIARRIGAQAETVIRFISEWTKSGWLRTEEKHLEILNREKLEEVRHAKSSRRASRPTSIYSAASKGSA